MEQIFGWRMVEEALARFFMVDAQHRAAFVSKIRNLQKLGLSSSAPGSGKRRKYSYGDIFDLALALALAQLGMDPSDIVGNLPPGVTSSLKDTDEYCVYEPNFLNYGQSFITFETKSEVRRRVSRLHFFAVVHLSYVKSQVRGRLLEVVRETYGGP